MKGCAVRGNLPYPCLLHRIHAVIQDPDQKVPVIIAGLWYQRDSTPGCSARPVGLNLVAATAPDEVSASRNSRTVRHAMAIIVIRYAQEMSGIIFRECRGNGGRDTVAFLPGKRGFHELGTKGMAHSRTIAQ